MATEVINEDVETIIPGIENEIKKVLDEIEHVNGELKTVEGQIARCYKKREKEHLQNKEQQLWKEKEQLRKEKEQLREKELLLIRGEQQSLSEEPQSKRRKLTGHSPFSRGLPCPKIGVTASQATRKEVEAKLLDIPLYLHWFGMKLYDLFHKEEGTDENLGIEIGTLKDSIPRKSLEDMVEAYQKIASSHQCVGGKEKEERSLTAQIATELNSYLYPKPGVGKVLHQMPVIGRSERPDWLASPVKECIAIIVQTALISDFKPNDLAESQTETFAYCSRVLGKKKHRQFLALCATCTCLEVYLISSLNMKMGKTLICNVSVRDTSSMKQLFYMLYGAVQYLTLHPIETELPSCSPLPNLVFSPEFILSKSNNIRVFHYNNMVYKLFDDDTTSKPNLAILQEFKYFESLELIPLNSGKRFKCLKYKYLNGRHENGNAQHFIIIAQILLNLHSSNFVHGDIREANLIYNTDTAYIIDFDMCSPVDALYPDDYVSDGLVRHPGAIAGQSMKQEHDIYSLKAIINEVLNLQFTGDLNSIIDELKS